MFLRTKGALFFFLLKAWELFFGLQGLQKECVQIDKYKHVLTKTTSKKHEKYIVKHCIKARIRTDGIAFPQASSLLIIIKDNCILSLSYSFFSSSTHGGEHTAVRLPPKSICIYCNEQSVCSLKKGGGILHQAESSTGLPFYTCLPLGKNGFVSLKLSCSLV